MSVLDDARPHADAIKAAITAQLGPSAAYDYGEVPGLDGNDGDLPRIFVVVSVHRRSNSNRRMTDQAGLAGWRASARSAGTTVDECRWAMWRVRVALNEQRLLVADHTTTPLRAEPDQDPRPDKPRFSALSSFTYTI